MALPAAIVQPPGAGEHHPGPADHTIKLASRHTGGQLSIEEFICPPGFTGPPVHVHRAHDETFVVLAGTLDFMVAGEAVSAPAGSLIYAPRGVAHAFANPHDQPATILGIYTPAGYEEYFADLAAAMAGGTLTADTLAAILARYHTDVVP